MIYVLTGHSGMDKGEVTIVHERDDINFDEIQNNLRANACF